MVLARVDEDPPRREVARERLDGGLDGPEVRACARLRHEQRPWARPSVCYDGSSEKTRTWRARGCRLARRELARAEDRERRVRLRDEQGDGNEQGVHCAGPAMRGARLYIWHAPCQRDLPHRAARGFRVCAAKQVDSSGSLASNFGRKSQGASVGRSRDLEPPKRGKDVGQNERRHADGDEQPTSDNVSNLHRTLEGDRNVKEWCLRLNPSRRSTRESGVDDAPPSSRWQAQRPLNQEGRFAQHGDGTQQHLRKRDLRPGRHRQGDEPEHDARRRDGRSRPERNMCSAARKLRRARQTVSGTFV